MSYRYLVGNLRWGTDLSQCFYLHSKTQHMDTQPCSEQHLNLQPMQLLNVHYSESNISQVQGQRWILRAQKCAAWPGLSHTLWGRIRWVRSNCGMIINRRNQRTLKNLCQCYFIHHESHYEWQIFNNDSVK